MTAVYRISSVRSSYDASEDILYVAFSEVRPVSGEDTEHGFIAHYAWPNNEVVGVTILDFCKRFASVPSEIEVDSVPPVTLILDGDVCSNQQSVG